MTFPLLRTFLVTSCLFLLLLRPVMATTLSVTLDGPTNSTMPAASGATNSPSTSGKEPLLVPHPLAELHASINLPEGWTLLASPLTEGGNVLATREKVSSEGDFFLTGLTLSVNRKVQEESGMKASDYALSMAKEAKERGGEEMSPIVSSATGPFRDIRFEFSIDGESGPIQMIEVLRANDTTNTLYVLLWQMPKKESATLRPLGQQIIGSLQLDPAF